MGQLKWVARCPVSKLKPYEHNPRKNDEAVGALVQSFSQFGFIDPIIVDKDFRVCAGHTRLKSATQLNLKTVPVLQAPYLTDKMFRAYNIANNQLGTIAKFDDAMLLEILQSLSDEDVDSKLLGFMDTDLVKLTKAVNDNTDGSDKAVVEYTLSPAIIVDCDTDLHQRTLLEEFTSKGLKCRALMLPST